MVLMALGTFAIGCIPSQSSIGMLAPILLLVARLVQGFSTGGEYGNAMTFIAEYAPDRRRGFLGSWLEFGTFTGYIMGAIIVTVAGAVLTDDQLLSLGLAHPVLRRPPAGPRRRLPAHPARGHPGVPRPGEGVRGAREGAAPRERGLRKLLTLWPFMLVCMGLVLAWNVTNYMLTSYMPTYVTDTMPEAAGAARASRRPPRRSCRSW